MKVALLHYWLTNMRGGEKVLAEFCRLFPEAEIYTHSYNPARMPEVINRHQVHESFIACLPGARRTCQKYLPLMPRALQSWDFSDYDLVLSSESGPIKGIRKPPTCRHICYCHTPMRYLWDMYDYYYRHGSCPEKIAMTAFKSYLRRYDLKSAHSVDEFIANSNFVAQRINRIYHRPATVIYPPVNSAYFAGSKESKADYYLFVGQLIPYKGPQLALEACRKLRRRLIVVGDGQLRHRLEAEYGDIAQFVGRVDDAALRNYYRRARALIFPGVEDFGIVPVEAQAAKTPVIALASGGALETVLPGKTGVFFDRPEVDDLVQAMLELEKLSFHDAAFETNVARFTPERFRREIKDFIQRALTVRDH